MKVIIGVIVENRHNLCKYFNLFSCLLENNQIERSICAKDFGRIETDKFKIDFVIKNGYSRGMKFHYILNLCEYDSKFDYDSLKYGSDVFGQLKSNDRFDKDVVFNLLLGLDKFENKDKDIIL